MDGLIAYALAKKYTDKVGQDIISTGFKVQVEEDRNILNRQGEEKVLYLLPKEYGSDHDGYDEFVYANNKWEWVGKTDVDLEDVFESIRSFSEIRDFEDSLGMVTTRGVALCRYADTGFFTPLPDFIKPLYRTLIIHNFRTSEGILQLVFWVDKNTNKAKGAFRISATNFIGITDWQELTGGGAQIVSGVVNANGTITFTDSEGNSFTTSGSNLVTSGNEQISVGYDNGGFYFLFDDGQEGE